MQAGDGSSTVANCVLGIPFTASTSKLATVSERSFAIWTVLPRTMGWRGQPPRIDQSAARPPPSILSVEMRLEPRTETYALPDAASRKISAALSPGWLHRSLPEPGSQPGSGRWPPEPA